MDMPSQAADRDVGKYFKVSVYFLFFSSTEF